MKLKMEEGSLGIFLTNILLVSLAARRPAGQEEGIEHEE